MAQWGKSKELRELLTFTHSNEKYSVKLFYVMRKLISHNFVKTLLEQRAKATRDFLSPQKMIRVINSLAISLVKTLLSQNYAILPSQFVLKFRENNFFIIKLQNNFTEYFSNYGFFFQFGNAKIHCHASFSVKSI